jgi:hypothetical protein
MLGLSVHISEREREREGGRDGVVVFTVHESVL